jgi:hypothetical protein
MSRHTGLVAFVTFVLGILASVLLDRVTVAQDGANARVRPESRFWVKTATVGQGQSAYVILVDTQTGETWTHSIPGGGWDELGSPALKKK